MILKSLKLENIRSYVKEEVEFPESSVLLNGDIGSGKSTILLAVEFALFGIKRGELSPASLLRNGKNTGEVELKIEVEGKEYVIKRVLKRGKDDIKQTAGYIIRDGVKKEGTSTELKAMILDILGYPKEMLNKKDLIYRYTVYTPQESMKSIVMGDKEERLEILRKIFGIDKYKRIRENSTIIGKHLKDKSKEIMGKIADIDEKKEFCRLKKNSVKELEIRLKEIQPEVDKASENLRLSRMEFSEIEKKVEELNKARKESEILNHNLMQKVNERNILTKEIDELTKQALKLGEEVKEKEGEIDLGALISEKRDKIKMLESKIMNLRSLVSANMAHIKSCNEVIAKIVQLNNCPLCEQEVEHSHKTAIRQREDRKIMRYNDDIRKIELEEKEEKEKLERRKKELDELLKKEKEFAVQKVRLESLKEKKNMVNEKKMRCEAIKKEIGEINVRKMQNSKSLEDLGDIEARYKDIRKLIDENSEKLKHFEIKRAEVMKEIEGLQSMITTVEKEIEEKEKAKAELKKAKDMVRWIEDYFVKLTIVMEKNILASIHSEFNSVFQNWFSTLIEDEIINARLDDEFTPVIEQNGYETSIDNLSGGEKTSVALSYRISLNRIINSMISSIKTKDILILDEPTDGFSTDQLDKVRDVLDQLDNKQIILVSHENKIESFVDNIIRISKEEHQSRIIA